MKKLHNSFNSGKILLNSEIELFKFPRHLWKTEFPEFYKKFMLEDVRYPNPVFPFRTFYKFPKNIIKELVDIGFSRLIQEAKYSGNEVILRQWLFLYVGHEFDYKPLDWLELFLNRHREFNLKSLICLLEKCCADGDFEAMHEIFNKINFRGYRIYTSQYLLIYETYLKYGLIEDGENFLKDHNIEKTEEPFIYILNALAAKGEYEKVLPRLHLISNYNLISNITNLMLNSEIDETGFTKICSTLNKYIERKNVKNMIYRLNKSSQFKKSLVLVEKFGLSFNEFEIRDVIFSFVVCDCPTEIYQPVLELLIDNLTDKHGIELMYHLDFDTALNLTKSLQCKSREIMLFNALLFVAVQNYDFQQINYVMKLSKTMRISNLNFSLVLILAPEVFNRSGVLDAFNQMGKSRNLLNPVCLFYLLANGYFDQFDKMAEQTEQKYKFRIDTHDATRYVLKCLPLDRINDFLERLPKAFLERDYSIFVSNAMIQLLCHYTESGRKDKLDDLNNLIKNYSYIEIDQDYFNKFLKSSQLRSNRKKKTKEPEEKWTI